MSDKIKENQNSESRAEQWSPPASNEVLFYKLDSENFRMEVQTDGDTVWLSLKQMADLFQRDKSVISRHIKNVFSEEELERTSVVAKFATTAEDGKIYQVEYFNLDVIISVGYRVKNFEERKLEAGKSRKGNNYPVFIKRTLWEVLEDAREEFKNLSAREIHFALYSGYGVLSKY